MKISLAYLLLVAIVGLYAVPQSSRATVIDQGMCRQIGVVGVPVGTCPAFSSGKPVYLKDANNCHVYFECSNGVAVCMYCPNYAAPPFGTLTRQHWDTTLETCNYPENAKCSLNAPTTTTTTIATTTTPIATAAPTTTTTQSTSTCPSVTTPAPTPTTTPGCTCPKLSRNYTPEPNAICKVEGLNADPTDCAIYYQCESYAANGWIIYTERCPFGAVFNPMTSACDYPANVPSCETYYYVK